MKTRCTSPGLIHAGARLALRRWALAWLIGLLGSGALKAATILQETFTGTVSQTLLDESAAGASVALTQNQLAMQKNAGAGNTRAAVITCFEVTGDFDVTAQVTRTQLTDSGKAGISVRFDNFGLGELYFLGDGKLKATLSVPSNDFGSVTENNNAVTLTFRLRRVNSTVTLEYKAGGPFQTIHSGTDPNLSGQARIELFLAEDAGGLAGYQAAFDDLLIIGAGMYNLNCPVCDAVPANSARGSFTNNADPDLKDDFPTGASFKITLLDGTQITVTNLQDPHTVVGRSEPFVEGDPRDATGLWIRYATNYSATLTNVADQLCGRPANFPEETLSRREVHTEILSLKLQNLQNANAVIAPPNGNPAAQPIQAGDVTIRAGQPYWDSVTNSPATNFFKNCLGEVASLYCGDPLQPTNDFPAKSFFNVYVEVEAKIGAIPKLYNKSPMLLTAEITQFPPDLHLPQSTYIHDPSIGAVQLYDVAGRLWGYLSSAGHGSSTNAVTLRGDAPLRLNCPASFTVGALCHTNGLPPTGSPNDALADLTANATNRPLTLYRSSTNGLPPDRSNIRDPALPVGADFAAGDALNSISFGRDGSRNPLSPACESLTGTLYFSVACGSLGFTCSAVNRNATVPTNEAAADVYVGAVGAFGRYTNAPSLRPAAGDNQLAAEEDQLGLAKGEHVTGLELSVFNGNTNDPNHDWLYATLTGPSYTNNPSLTNSGATIFTHDPARGALSRSNLTVFATPDTLGLTTNDVIDALVLSDITPGVTCPPKPNRTLNRGTNGVVEFDEVLFSLAPGSPSLTNNALGLKFSAADVLSSSFDGTFKVFATAGSLGLLFEDDLDAADIKPSVPLEVSCHPGPASQTVFAGNAATFTGFPLGWPPFFYQWKSNDVVIAGATNASYTTPPLPIAASGTRYTMVVSNAFSSTSCEALVTVNPLPTTCGPLRITLSLPNVILFWPTNSGCVLESSPTVSNPNWIPVPGPYPVVSGTNQVTIPISGRQFFRLRLP